MYITGSNPLSTQDDIAAALAALGAEVTLVSGPTALPDPAGVTVRHVETARVMLAACKWALPADVAVCAAAVADWGVAAPAEQKLKKTPGGAPPALALCPNPDILAELSAAAPSRPRLVVGFAAAPENLVAPAREKRARKGCDWIVANDVSPRTGTFGGDANQVHLITADACDAWPALDKRDVAARLATRIAEALS
jgi:phosphopantothenoylcysteine decarboxylase/phosphopantothenate--cysteine ligase